MCSHSEELTTLHFLQEDSEILRFDVCLDCFVVSIKNSESFACDDWHSVYAVLNFDLVGVINP